MEGLRGPSLGMRRLGRLAGLVEPSSSRACFNHRYKKEWRFSKPIKGHSAGSYVPNETLPETLDFQYISQL